MMTLLFTSDFHLLGEFVFEKGALKHSTLSDEGEKQLGELSTSWQTMGIALTERLTQASETQTSYILARRHVLLSSAEAYAAFLCWVAEGGYIAIELKDRLVPHWQTLCHIHLEPEERFAALKAMLTATHDVLQAWEKGMKALSVVA